MSENVKLLRSVLFGSKEYKMDGSILTIKGYYSGDRIKLDLALLLDHEELVEEMVDQASDEEEWY